MNNNEELIARIDALEKWKADREKQQITFPLDIQSRNILNKFFMHITDTVITEGGVGANTFIQYVGLQDQFKFLVNKDTNITFTVNTTSDVLTVTDGFFANDMMVYVATNNTLPNPLSSLTQYFVVNAAAGGRSFQLSTSQGGAPEDITTTGTGIQYIYFF